MTRYRQILQNDLPRPDMIPGVPIAEQEAAGNGEAGDENDQETHLRDGRKEILRNLPQVACLAHDGATNTKG